MSQLSDEVYLVYVNTLANNNKFWKAIARNNGNLEVTWGRVGYKGQSQVHNCNSYEFAISKLEILANNKRQKGYRDSVVDSKLSQEKQVHRALELLSLLKNNRNSHNYTEMLNEYLSLYQFSVKSSLIK